MSEEKQELCSSCLIKETSASTKEVRALLMSLSVIIETFLTTYDHQIIYKELSTFLVCSWTVTYVADTLLYKL